MAELIKAPVMFTAASDALAVALAFESGTEEFCQYEVNAVFDNYRQPIGYQVRVKNLDGFFVGYLA